MISSSRPAAVSASPPVRQPFRHLDEQRIARGLPQAVVDVPEALQVDQEYRQPVAGRRGALHVLRQPLAEQQAIREPGEHVVAGNVIQLLLHARRHVAQLGLGARQHDRGAGATRHAVDLAARRFLQSLACPAQGRDQFLDFFSGWSKPAVAVCAVSH